MKTIQFGEVGSWKQGQFITRLVSDAVTRMGYVFTNNSSDLWVNQSGFPESVLQRKDEVIKMAKEWLKYSEPDETLSLDELIDWNNNQKRDESRR